MWIKICGNTNLEDARLAAEFGADAVGFVFAPGPRQVTATEVAEILPNLPNSVEKIGVFSSRNFQEIAGTVRETGLTGIQLHGGFDLELVRRLSAAFSGSLTMIQVLHWNVDEGAESASEIALQLKEAAGESAVHKVLLDSKTSNARGGTGQSFNWAAARVVMNSQPGLQFIAAGGLTPDKIVQAIAELRPWGVDVASGVEASKGRKNPRKLKLFIEAARSFRFHQAGPG